ncbi:quercetin dioxygenase-like cupin family protein [Paraburkholderia sp. WC7.3g]|uniref:cupin domain-containing protein n=1 Tax=Paraburkholderia sp. WC7.3g TaxID=2991070 RepID=UPI003D19CC26
MKATRNTVVGLLSAFALVFGSGTARAQETGAPKMEQKVFVDNERVKVAENTFKPGAESPNIARPFRVVRAIKGGKFQRIYADGRKEVGQYQTGDVESFDAGPPHIFKNLGDTEIVLYIVYIKK